MRSSTWRGRPALGWTEMGLSVTPWISSRAFSIADGPTEQLRPTAVTPFWAAIRAMAWSIFSP